MAKRIICIWLLLTILVSSSMVMGAEKFTLQSSSFEHNKKMPAIHKNDRDNRSPALSWKNPPAGTKSFMITCEDLDVSWTHWEIYNILATYSELPENIPYRAKWKDGIIQGTNSFGSVGWGGPQPPRGSHRYEFKIYALDVEVLASTKREYIKQHTLGTASIIGISN